MAKTICYEAGNAGTLVSLGGIKSAPGYGRVLEQEALAINTTDGIIQVLPPNGKRIAALIAYSGGETGYIRLFPDKASGQIMATLYPGQSFQIDALLPWTGAIYAAVLVANGNLLLTEVSVY